MGKMRHLAGKRISKSHTTVIEAAVPVVKFLQTIPAVSKVGLGRLDVHLPVTEWRIKAEIIRGGLKLQIRGTNSIQQVMVYTSSIEEVLDTLQVEFGKKYKFIL